jgi:hypothetical protein
MRNAAQRHNLLRHIYPGAAQHQQQHTVLALAAGSAASPVQRSTAPSIHLVAFQLRPAKLLEQPFTKHSAQHITALVCRRQRVLVRDLDRPVASQQCPSHLTHLSLLYTSKGHAVTFQVPWLVSSALLTSLISRC